MHPANTPLCLIPGTTHRSTLRIMQPTWIYKPVTGIEASAPVRLHVPDHGIETDSWPCWLAGVQHMPELNRARLGIQQHHEACTRASPCCASAPRAYHRDPIERRTPATVSRNRAPTPGRTGLPQWRTRPG